MEWGWGGQWSGVEEVSGAGWGGQWSGVGVSGCGGKAVM